MKQHIANLTSRPRKGGDDIYVWQPGPSRRKAGWKAVALKSKDGAHSSEREAIAQAQWLNAILDAWAAGKADRVKTLLAAWANGHEEREEKRKLTPCAFISPPFSGKLSLPAPTLIRHITAQDLWDNYTESKEFKRAAASTQDTYRRQFSKIIDWLGPAPPARLTAEACEDYFSKIDGAATAALRHSVARAVFKYNARKKHIPDNPFSLMTVDTPPPRIRIWSEEEIDASLSMARQHGYLQLRFAIELGLSTAQRPIDFARLGNDHRIDGRNWRGWRIMQVKTDKIVEPVPDAFFVSEDFIERLAREHQENMRRFPDIEDRLEVLRTEKPKLFGKYNAVPYLVRDDGSPYSPPMIAAEWRELRAIVGQDVPSILGKGRADGLDARIQDLRDTAITSMAQRGWSLMQICAQSGHEPSHVGKVLKHYVAMTGDMTTSSNIRETIIAAEAIPTNTSGLNQGAGLDADDDV